MVSVFQPQVMDLKKTTSKCEPLKKMEFTWFVLEYVPHIPACLRKHPRL